VVGTSPLRAVNGVKALDITNNVVDTPNPRAPPIIRINPDVATTDSSTWTEGPTNVSFAPPFWTKIAK
jgi:hypothetical protein